MKIIFRIWRQESPDSKGSLKEYEVDGLSEEMSFLEALDHLNEQLVLINETVIAYEYDCREGICGQCGETVIVEPWRARAFPVVKDLIVDRSAFDRIVEHGAYISAKTGAASEANSILVSKEVSDKAMDAAACIGCGACVATCKNASAVLFTSAKINHLNALPQGQPEAHHRVLEMNRQMQDEGFGHCTFTSACEVECPANISITNIAEMNARLIKAKLFG
jgi:succinate dehydrogenase / fumarate reductase iron-sulfur subunit